MGLDIAGMNISRVSVIDDNEGAREGWSLSLEEASLTPVSESGPLPRSLQELVGSLKSRADAVFCDHHLKRGTYSSFNGAEAVAFLYDERMPAVLCTAWEKASIDEMRPFMNRIPALISVADASPDTIVHGLGKCIKEFQGDFSSEREPWRSQVYVDDVDPSNGMTYVVVPGWHPSEIIRLPISVFPTELHDQVRPNRRFYAQVNKGTESQEELYFSDFTLD